VVVKPLQLAIVPGRVQPLFYLSEVYGPGLETQGDFILALVLDFRRQIRGEVKV
jgi:hypothetical protein